MNNTGFVIFFIFLMNFQGIQAQHEFADTVLIKKRINELVKNPNKADIFDEAVEIERLSKAINYTYGETFALNQKSYYYCFKGEYDKALKLSQEAYKKAIKLNNVVLIEDVNYGLGYIYQEMNELDKAQNYYETTLMSLTKRDKTDGKPLIWNALGSLHIKKGEVEKGLEYLLKAKKVMEEIQPEKLPTLVNNIAIAYVQLGQAEASIPYFEQYYDFIQQKQDSLQFAPILGNLAYCYQNLGDFDRAFSYYQSSLAFSEKFGQDEITYITYLDMSDGYRLAGNYPKALEYYQKYHELYQKVFNQQMQGRIDELEVKFDTEKKEKDLLKSQNQVTKLQVGQQRMIIIIIALVAGLIISSLIFLKKRSDAKKKEELLKIQEQLIQSELKNKELEAQQLQNQLKNKEADLTNLALDIARKNEFSNQLINELEALQKTKSIDMKIKLRDVISFTVNHLQINEDLTLLQENVDQINQDFYEKLEINFGKLIPNEKYLAGLIRLNLSNKDVAALRGISVSSAKMNRYRLRKKLGLDAQTNIVEYLNKI